MTLPRTCRSSRSALLAGLLSAGLLLAGCGGDSGADSGSGAGDAGGTTDAAASSGGSSSGSTDGAEVSGELTVYAAASLKGAFDELTAAFAEAHPDVTFAPTVYDGSSTLVTQLTGGAPADVFASADEPNMDDAVSAELTADDPVLFATNELVIAVEQGNPLGIESLEDLADGTDGADAPITVMCAAEVPCGNAARTLLEAAGVELTPASEEQNVSATLSKVVNGEADAGLVYRTDVATTDGEVEAGTIDGAAENPNRYPITVLQDADAPDAAQAFVDFVLSEEGQQVLEDFGFGAP
ncbi:molybdate ABC transporter substrate-binding protein [Citricoccus muralis]|uniref:Molybdate ABC transporter substrate-binding protein n=1 Tax=Citricoccus muralis TaxID=169134 RepID=A0ABY8H7M8_9MICC|nr:molybdate ABC transporter substrate-binding protein [Citricoccus muralis]WFP16668.1 molybdate ABC transporter substrate-binding protein [Citricoccus muralis]